MDMVKKSNFEIIDIKVNKSAILYNDVMRLKSAVYLNL